MKPLAAVAAPLTSSRWFKLVWIIPLGILSLLTVVVIAQWLRRLPGVETFVAAHPGAAGRHADTPVGFPGWLGWQHFFNSLVIIMLIRSGWQVRTTQRPAAFWTRRNEPPFKTKNPPKKISLDLWFHLTMAALFVVNGAIFYLLLFCTGQWKRLVPSGFDVFPNAASALLQYASMHWPTENGWVNYNALQQLAYFATVFIAAPLAILTGFRQSAAWPRNAKRLNKIYPVEWARAVHFPVMLYFVGFLIVHVTLVLATGARTNLGHMYAARDDGSWIGLAVFALSLAAIAAAWVGAQPVFLQPVASLTGNLSRR